MTSGGAAAAAAATEAAISLSWRPGPGKAPGACWNLPELGIVCWLAAHLPGHLCHRSSLLQARKLRLHCWDLMH